MMQSCLNNNYDPIIFYKFINIIYKLLFRKKLYDKVINLIVQVLFLYTFLARCFHNGATLGLFVYLYNFIILWHCRISLVYSLQSFLVQLCFSIIILFVIEMLFDIIFNIIKIMI